MKKRINFKDAIPKLSEEQIKQICRFTKTDYVEGEWQKWAAFSAFKCWHYNEMKQRDIAELRGRIREIEKRSKQYPPVQRVVNEYVKLKDKLSNLELGVC